MIEVGGRLVDTSRRGFLRGLIAAPAILKLGLWMPVRKIIEAPGFVPWQPFVTFSWGSFGGDFPLPTDELVMLVADNHKTLPAGLSKGYYYVITDYTLGLADGNTIQLLRKRTE